MKKEKEELKEKRRTRIIKIGKLIIFLLILIVLGKAIVISYDMGRVAGTIQGVSAGLELNNVSLCEGLELERDLDGFCIVADVGNLSNTIYKDCSYEKFKIIGTRESSFLIKVRNDFLEWVTYPMIRC